MWSSDIRTRASLIKRLTTLTPEALWNLAPWSWATDWFANVGDVISNMTAFAGDNLVLRYGYLMEHSMIEDTYTRNDISAGSFQLITESKRRIKANPFGFGVSWEDLSPFQLSIAAALGLSKS
jgi:hypothetical protein